MLGADGALYVCQNGGTVGPWRAAEMVDASIQRVREGGKAETLITEVEGIKLNGPNDLVFAPDGSLVFSDPGTYNPKNPDPSYIHRLLPDGTAKVLVAFAKPVFPNGVTSRPTARSCGTNPIPGRWAASGRTARSRTWAGCPARIRSPTG